MDSGIRGWPAILAAFAIELVLYNPPVDAQPWAVLLGPWVWLGTKLVMLYVVMLNVRGTTAARRLAWLVAGLGLALNTLVIAANAGYMPQSRDAAAAVWGGARTLDPGRLHNVVPIGPTTQLAWLGDVIPQPAWFPRANVVSIGDIMLALGMASYAFVTSRPSSRLLRISWNRAPFHGDARPQRRCST